MNLIIPSEACHFYYPDGTPCYEVENKSKPGTFRPTTLRDAKKLGLVPSVTSVLSLIAKPSLSAWKEQQILLSAATSPHDRNVLDAVEWANKVLEDAQAQSKQAADKGTSIHGAIEKYILGEQVSGEYQPFVDPVVQKLECSGILNDLKAEHSFAHKFGFGGKVDLHTPTIIIDFKTKSFTAKDIEEKKKLAYDENCWQLAAYRLGLNLPYAKCQNWFISTSEPGLIKVHEWNEEELAKGKRIFIKTLELWQEIKL